MNPNPVPIPLTILTGFLGAGKTTLLNRMLHGDHGLRVAVLVNDFGAINIDTQLVVGVEGETISLANGCICCTIRDDLLATAVELLKRPDRPEYLLIEASGVSDPWAVAETFQLPELRPFIHLDGVIAVVDAEYVDQQRDYADLIVDQISAADIVVLNKVDLVDATRRTAINAWVRTIVPRARVVEATYGQAPLELLLGVGRYRLMLESLTPTGHHHDHDHHDHDHGAAFATWSYTADRPFDLRALRKVILDLPPAIFRAKGVIWLADAPQRQAVLQLVGQRVSLTLRDLWGETPPRTQLVTISAPRQLDTADLQRRLDACLAAPALANAEVSDQTWLRSSV